MKQKICIMGAGVCGLSIGWHLIQKGHAVTIYEKNSSAGQGATNYSGGMLAAGIENEPSESDLWHLTRYAQTLWHDFKNTLEQSAQTDIGYNDSGTMMVATTADDLEYVKFLYDYQKDLGVELEYLSARDIEKKEPYLKTVGGMFCKNDHQVNSILLSKALEISFQKMGGVIQYNTKVDSVKNHNGSVSGIVLSDGHFEPADSVVVCAGIDCPEIKGITDRIAVRPLKGQMVSLRTTRPLLKTTIWTPRTYLIPKSDSHMLIGATVEEQGFNKDVTVGGVYALLESAWRAMPAIEDMVIEDIWVSHRPTARDDTPIMGQLSTNNLFIATGHHRNGILLAPATGKIMADMICGIAPPHDLKNILEIVSPQRLQES